MKYYLAGPIDHEKDLGKGWRNKFKTMFDWQYSDIIFFDPVAPYHFTSVTPKISTYIYNINMKALEQADAIIARLVKGQISIGTPIELYHAIEWNMPIFLLTDIEKSIYMSYIMNQSCTVVRDLKSLHKAILQYEMKCKSVCKDEEHELKDIRKYENEEYEIKG